MKKYNQQTNHKWEEIGLINTGAIDSRGREVGFLVSKYEYDVVEVDENHECSLIEMAIGHYVRLSAISSRNGTRYGSAAMDVTGTDVVEIRKELDIKIARATKVVIKKWAAFSGKAVA